MRTKNRELWLALLAILIITLLYSGVLYWLKGTPAAGSLFGHSLGVIGFLLMLITETVYSLRKRSRLARWGRMVNWLQFHIFTGLVGPYLVLLHTSWKFNGLAGVVMLLTLVIVASGFIGRYIYTAVPRTADGTELQARELAEQARLVQAQIALWMEANPQPGRAFEQRLAGLQAGSYSGASLVVPRVFRNLAEQWASWRAGRNLPPEMRSQARHVSQLIHQQRTLQRQIRSLAAARRMLAVWHSVHIPIGLALFTAAFVHIIAAVYYATLLH